MKYYVSSKAKRSGDGSKKYPFKTISEAAAIAVAGDKVIVSPGIYREYINPANGGTSDVDRIVYKSTEKGKAVITGAEIVKNWKNYSGDVWVVRISNGLFGDYNPYKEIIHGDWYFSNKKVHTGEVYLNGKSFYEVCTIEEVKNPEFYDQSWDRENTLYKWYTEQDGDYTVIYANFQGHNPNKENVEINVRRNCFFPKETGKDYITVSGFTIKQAATQWAPPTAFQDGMIGPHWSKGWIIEDCIIHDSKCSGISLGKHYQPDNNNKWSTQYVKDGTQNERDIICQSYHEGWTKDQVGSHIIRRCEIFDCGQTGIVGHLGCVFCLIEDNHIYQINNKQDLFGAEIAGIKLHAPIDTIFRRNHIHHCSRGIWLDWQAQGTRITQSLFHDNVPAEGVEITNAFSVGEDIFVEVAHGPTLIDNNIMLSECAARISTQGVALVHNLIAGSFTYVGVGTDNGGSKLPTPRYTPYHVPHDTKIAGFMTFLHGDMRFYNNIFIQQPVGQYLKDVDASGTPTGSKMDSINYDVGTFVYDGYPHMMNILLGFPKIK